MLGLSEDLGILVAEASRVLEHELHDRLRPLWTLREVLAGALERSRKVRLAGQLAGTSGRQATTLYGSWLLLAGLRKALSRSEGASSEAAVEGARVLSPEFLRPLLEGDLLAQIERVRTDYRNAAAHGRRAFDPPSYRAFCELLIAAPSFTDWVESGPSPVMLARGRGLLHRLLLGPAPDCSRPRPQARLALLSQRGTLGVEVMPTRVRRSRDLANAARPAGFHIGDSVVVSSRVEDQGHLILIDVGTSGRMAVLRPNEWAKETMASGPVRVPRDLDPFEITLTGLPGTETLIAVASTTPLPWPALPSRGASFRPVGSDDLALLVDILEDWDPAGFGVALAPFQVALP